MFSSINMEGNDKDTGRHRWNPWRHLAHWHPHIRVTCSQALPGTRRASWTKHGIYIDRSLDQVARRCALAHEIIHLERGPLPQCPRLARREEHIVSVTAARRLIPLDTLTDAVMWVNLDDPHELADELWVDTLTLKIRITNLMPDEHAHISRELAQRQPWNT